MSQKDQTHYIMAMVSNCLCGFFAVPLMPVFLEIASEITFPISESFSSSILMGTATLVSAVFIFIAEALKQTARDPRSGKEYVVSMQNAMWFCMACLILAIIIAAFLPTRYKRMEHEKSLHDLKTSEEKNI